jgi:hypothetical protein
MLLDDIRIPEIGYSTDLEVDDGGWEADGFVRIQNVLPQTFNLALILNGNQTEVQKIPLPPDNHIEVPITFGQGVDEIILMVAGTARHTRQTAPYQVTILSPAVK